MSRTYIPFYLDQKTNTTLYYDYVEQVFFTSSNEKKGRFFSILSGMAGVVVYLLLRELLDFLKEIMDKMEEAFSEKTERDKAYDV